MIWEKERKYEIANDMICLYLNIIIKNNRLVMQELKVQNALLLQLVKSLQNQINSKNRQNQLLFQQYETLAADNQSIQRELETLKTHNRELRRSSFSSEQSRNSQNSSNNLELSKELQQLKKRCANDSAAIEHLKIESNQKGGVIILLQNQLQEAKLQLQLNNQKDRNQSGLTEKMNQLESLLQHKEKTVTELTQFLNDQSERINALTVESIKTIQNYEAKLLEKDVKISQKEQQTSTVSEKLAKLTELYVKVSATAEGIQNDEDSEHKKRISELQAILSSKEQALAELSQFLQNQSNRLNELEAKLSESGIEEQTKVYEAEISSLKQIVASKQQSVAELSQFLNSVSSKNIQMEEQLLKVNAANVEDSQQKINQVIYDDLLKAYEDLKVQLQQKDTEIQQNKIKIKESLQLIDQLKSKDTNQANPQVNQLRQICQELKNGLQLKEKTVTQLTEFLNDQSQRINSLTVEGIKTIENYETKLLEKDQKITQKQKQIASVSNKLAKLTELYVSVSATAEGIQNNEENQQKQRINELSSILSSKQQALAELSQFLQNQTGRLNQLQSKVSQSGIEERIHSYEMQIESLKQIILNKEQSVAELSQFLNNVSSKNIELEEQMSKTVIKQQEQKKEDKIQQGQNRQQQKYDELLKEKEHLNVQLQETKEMLVKKQKQLNQVYQKIDKKDQALRQFTQFIDQQTKRATELDFKCEEYLQTIEELKNNQNTSTPTYSISENIAGIDSIDKLRKIIADLELTITNKSDNIQQLTQFMNEQAMKLVQFQQSKIGETEQQINELKVIIDDLQQTITSKTQNIGELSEFMNEQAEKILQLEDKIGNNQNNKEQTGQNNSNTQLLQKIDDLERTIISKEANIQQFSSFMNEQAEKIMELQAKLQVHQPKQTQGQTDPGKQQNQSTKQLQQNIDDLQDTIKSKSQTIAELSEFMNEQSLRIIQLQQKLSQYEQTQEDKGKGEKEPSPKERIEQIENILKSKQQTIEELTEYLNEQLAKIAQLQKNLSAQEPNKLAQAQQLQQQNVKQNENNQQIESLSKANQKLKEELTEYQEMFQRKKKDVDQLEQTITKKDQALLQFTEFIDQQTKRATELDFKCQEYANTIEELKNNQTKIVTFENQQPTDLKQQISDLQATVSNKDQTIGEFTSFMNEQSNKIIELQQQLQKMEKNNEANNVGSESNDKVLQLQTIIKSKQQSIAQLTVYLQQQSTLINELQSQLTQSTQTIQVLKNTSCAFTKRQTENDQTDVNEDVKMLRIKLQQNQAQLNGLKNDIIVKQEKISELQILNGVIDENRAALSTKEDEVAHLRQIISQKDQSLQQFTDFIDQLTKRNDELELTARQIAQQKEDTSKVEESSSVQKGQQNLLQTIADLQNIIKSKTDNLGQMSQFMNEQAETIQQLEIELVKYRNGERLDNNKQTADAHDDKISQLENIIKSKDQSIAELSQYLEEQYTKISNLQEELSKLQTDLVESQAELTKSVHSEPQVDKNQEMLKKEELHLQMGNQLQLRLKEKKQLLNEMQILLEQKHMEVESIKSQLKLKEEEKRQDQFQIQQKQTLLNQFSHKIYQMQQKTTVLQNKLKDLTQKNGSIQQQNQHFQNQISQKQQLIQMLQAKIIEHEQTILTIDQIESNYQQKIKVLELENIKRSVINQDPAENDTDRQNASRNEVNQEVEELLAEKDQELVRMMEIMENLQHQIRGKGEVIEELEEQLKRMREKLGVEDDDYVPTVKFQDKDKQIQQLVDRLAQNQSQLTEFRERVNDLQDRLDKQQGHIQLQQQYDMIEMEQEMIEKSKNIANSYKQELQDIRKDEAKSEPVVKEEEGTQKSQQDIGDQELTITQTLEQLLVYSEQGQDIQAIRKLFQDMRRLFKQQVGEFQDQNNELKQTLNSLLQINNNLQEEVEKFRRQAQENGEVMTEKDQIIDQLQRKNRKVEDKLNSQIKELRNSITNFEESPINAAKIQQTLRTVERNHHEHQQILKLQEQIAHLKADNKLKEVQLIKLKPKDQNFARQLNDLLLGDSINAINNTNTQEDREDKEEKDKLERALMERDGVIQRCQEYEQQIKQLEKHCSELALALQNITNQVQQNAKEQMLKQEQFGQSVVKHQSNGQSAGITHKKVLAALDEPHPRNDNHFEGSYEHHSQQIHQDQVRQFQEMQLNLSEKNEMIAELQQTILKIQNGYNSEIMSLRKNIAQLNNEIISLRKHLYQANPNALDLSQFIKDTFSHQEKDTQFFRHDYPSKYSQNYLPPPPPPPAHNSSYYTQHPRDRVNRARSIYQPYFAQQLNLGQKFMGRPCRQAATPYSSLMAADGINSMRYNDYSRWQDRRRQ